MADEKGNNIKLGAFVLAGIVVLVLGLYLLGAKRDLFSRTLDVSAHFKQVSGLRTGNNVRYSGIDVGTVEGITIVSDTEIVVDMMIQIDAAKHIRTNALASIASDGLMGNQLVKIEPGEGTGGPIGDGAVLKTSAGVDTDAMLRTLGTSNENLVVITGDLRELTRKLNTANGPIALLSDTSMATDMRDMVLELNTAAANARAITERVNEVVRDLQAGHGALGVLVSDPATERQVRDMLATLGSVTDSLALVSASMSRFASGLNEPGGLAHTLTRDTAVVADVRHTIANLDTSAATLSEDLRALQKNWLFRKYFKEKEKEEKKREKDAVKP
ncbi:MAG: MlaD family protein [Flavobacteriales bacterium]